MASLNVNLAFTDLFLSLHQVLYIFAILCVLFILACIFLPMLCKCVNIQMCETISFLNSDLLAVFALTLALLLFLALFALSDLNNNKKQTNKKPT